VLSGELDVHVVMSMAIPDHLTLCVLGVYQISGLGMCKSKDNFAWKYIPYCAPAEVTGDMWLLRSIARKHHKSAYGRYQSSQRHGSMSL
jgi:hypothetical protein